MTLPRPHIPMRVKLHAAIIQLGLDPATAELDHDPALGLREFNKETGLYIPDANDPHYLKYKGPKLHDIKTNGPGGECRITSYGSDKHAIAKVRRLSRATAEAQQRLLAKGTGEAIPERRTRKIPSRSFAKGHRPLRAGNYRRRQP